MTTSESQGQDQAGAQEKPAEGQLEAGKPPARDNDDIIAIVQEQLSFLRNAYLDALWQCQNGRNLGENERLIDAGVINNVIRDTLGLIEQMPDEPLTKEDLDEFVKEDAELNRQWLEAKREADAAIDNIQTLRENLAATVFDHLESNKS